MSFSDVTFSSPRKGYDDYDKSDDEFEKFLNESSVSELSSKFKKKKGNNEPWWMKNDDKPLSSSKSFIKQPKPKMTIPEIDENETQNVTNSKFIKSSAASSTNKSNTDSVILNRDAINSTIKNSYLKDTKKPNVNEIKFNIPEISMNSTLTSTTENDEDEESTSRRKFSARKDSNRSLSKIDDHLDEEELSEMDEKPTQFIKSNKNNKTLDNGAANTHEDHLLSKVMFLDSLESAMNKTGLNNTNNQNNITNVVNAPHMPISSNKKGLKVQISEDRIEHPITDESEAGNKFDASMDEIDYGGQSTKLTTKNTNDTQTNNDIQQLQEFYRKNLSTTANTITPAHDDDDINETIKTKVANDLSFIFKNNNEKSGVSSNEIYDSTFGLQAINFKNIRQELEERTLQEILKDMETTKTKESIESTRSRRIIPRSHDESKPQMKQSSKYNYVKSSGYGKPSYSPKRMWSAIQNDGFINNSEFVRPKSANNAGTSVASSKSYVSLVPDTKKSHLDLSDDDDRQTRLFTKQKSFQNTESLENYRRQIHALMDDRENDKTLLIEFKNEFSKREEEYRKNIEKMKLDHERIIFELQSKIESMTNQLSEKQSSKRQLLNDLKSIDTDKRIEMIEKDVIEQEKLISGYQLENERLYAELKTIKDTFKIQKHQLEFEIENLKVTLVNKNAQLENMKQTSNLNHFSHQVPSDIGNDKDELEYLRRLVQKLEYENEQLRKQPKEAKVEQRAQPQIDPEEMNDLKRKLEFYEKNQHYIEQDQVIIEARNKEIKRLNEKIRHLETGKNPPDSTKRIKELQTQVREFDTALKRLRNTRTKNTSEAHSTGEFLKLDYYEKRIETLEKNMSDKTQDMDRLCKMWKQKNEMLKLVYDEQVKQFEKNSISFNRNLHKIDSFNLEQKLDQIQMQYSDRIEQLENENRSFKTTIENMKTNEAEKVKQLNEKIKMLENELENKTRDIRILIEKQAEATASINKLANAAKKEYEPKIFKDNEQVQQLTSESTRVIMQENEKLKTKFAELSKEFDKRVKEFDLNLTQIKEASDIQIRALRESHKSEIEKLVQTLTGTNFNGNFDVNNMDSNVIASARSKFFELKSITEEQQIIIAGLKERCAELEVFKDRYQNLERVNREMSEQMNTLKSDLHFARLHHSPEMKHFDELKSKLEFMENKYQKREKELQELINNKYADSLKLIDSNFDSSLSSGTVQQQSQIIQKYERILEQKNKEILKFRLELDSMLELLKSLQTLQQLK